MNLRQKLINSALYDWFGKRSFAQAGEDMVAWSVLGKRQGFYVDIGAYHPKQFSNTYFFYKKGWRGIVVEPNPDLVRLYKDIRRRDVALGVGVGLSDEVKMYFMFADPAANTFDEETAERNKEVGRKLIGKKPVAILKLSKILRDYLPVGQKVDLLSVDTEGMDEEVLASNDWKKYRPRVVICEDLEFDWTRPERSKVAKMMKELDYRLVGMTPYSLIFQDEKQEEK